ncbi:MAG: SUMF1/EgtB/PvdO family nonheme iron enzyme [Polyangia bacterium]|jgi:formylglycine-generating enzyme required for sulfatase activity|nr:SUMF1/EgtB/PvdO family nonheme iron enzyme [Polyangia bacterium]
MRCAIDSKTKWPKAPRAILWPFAATLLSWSLLVLVLGSLASSLGDLARAAQAPLPTGRITAPPSAAAAELSVPGGWFRMGSRPEDLRAALAELGEREGRGALRRQLLLFLQEELPERRIHLGPYRIDRLEVTRAAYEGCVRRGPCKAVAAPSTLGAFARPDAPMVNVTWEEAGVYCRFVGKRLPTEAEWEKAARGPFGRVWPWGPRWQEKACNHGTLHPVHSMFHLSASDGFLWVAPVGSFPGDRSYYGVMDLAGNVAEWVADWYQPGWWTRGQVPAHAPKGPSGGNGRLIKGGSYSRLRILSRPAAKRLLLASEQRAGDVGFRCARDLRR